ncbi:hypothetical protein A3Q29_07080 [Providencia stuartii]|uniref:Tail spike TSP1/Gp66 N-terminal domain-containing protein n=1 Tax=Providencia stuartii TaxID=588 RepID=A0A1S1HLQ1_PROST|nr:hypothetical protein A3Q29_07080 [Providencia stuartii]
MAGTIPTKNPVPSKDIRDLGFNSEKIDEFVTSLQHSYTDRFGKCHRTVEGMNWVVEQLIEQFKIDVNQAIIAAGYAPVGTFQDGAAVTLLNHVVLWSLPDGDGEYYRWEGSLEKIIPANSTPQTTGGVEKGAWVLVGIKNWESVFDADLNAIARLHNVNVNQVSTLTLTTVDNCSLFFNSASKVCYYALSPITGEITYISSDNDGVVTLTVSGNRVEIYRAGMIAGNVEFRRPQSQSTTHVILRSVNIGGTRVHIEPNGNVEGTTAKLDWMFDPYDKDPNNYRIGSIYSYTGDPNSTGEGAVYVYNAKSVGAAWGNWPSMHFGFQDDSVGGTPMKIMFFDTGASQFYAPMKGMWHHGKKVKAGDYVTASIKIYRAVNTGTTGNITPSHTSGSVSDGSVTWEFIRAPRGQDVKPAVIFGERDDMPMFGLPNHRVQVLKPVAVGKGGFFDFFGRNDELVGRMIPSTGAGGERLLDIVSSDGGSRLRLNSTSKTLQTANLATVFTAKTQNTVTQIDVSATTLVRVGNSTPYIITRFVGGTGGQVFYLESTTAGQTTLKHNSYIRLKAGADVVLSDKHVIAFLIASDGETAMQI